MIIFIIRTIFIAQIFSAGKFYGEQATFARGRKEFASIGIVTFLIAIAGIIYVMFLGLAMIATFIWRYTIVYFHLNFIFWRILLKRPINNFDKKLFLESKSRIFTKPVKWYDFERSIFIYCINWIDKNYNQ